MKGTVKFFNDQKGFGFIIAEDEKEFFVHKTALSDGIRLSEGDNVTFEVAEGEKGPHAINVKKE